MAQHLQDHRHQHRADLHPRAAHAATASCWSGATTPPPRPRPSTSRPAAPASEITYTNELQFNGLAKVAAPLGKVVFEKLGNDTEKQLTDVLNGLARR